MDKALQYTFVNMLFTYILHNKLKTCCNYKPPFQSYLFMFMRLSMCFHTQSYIFYTVHTYVRRTFYIRELMNKYAGMNIILVIIPWYRVIHC